MAEYTVLSRQFFKGTIADLPMSARLAWLVVLFEAERERGRVKLPLRALANDAKISVPEAAEALRIFQEPDPYSSSKAMDGRRLIAIEDEEDWYSVVNWEKHAAEREKFFARVRQQRRRAEAKGNVPRKDL